MLEKFYSRKTHSISPALAELFELTTKEKPTTLKEAIALSQTHFLRPKDKERWELKDCLSYKIKKRSFDKLLLKLGLLAPITPTKKNYDSILLLGAETSDFIHRLSFLRSLDVKSNQLYLLTGKRVLCPKEIKILKKLHIHLPENREDFMMEALFPKEINHTIISCPNHADLTRVNTADTIIKWMEKYGNSRKNLLISTQPFANYQLVLAKNITKASDQDIVFDIAAPERLTKYSSVSIALDTIARILYELEKFIP